jgi:branched-chain amino acid transport system ATP-binding protein
MASTELDSEEDAEEATGQQAPTDPLLRVVDLRKRFGGITAVDGANFEVEAGAIVGLIGPNGAGKTTAFDLISGLLKPDGGHVYYRGTDLQDIMRPSRAELLIWSLAAALTVGTVGYGVAAGAGIAPWLGALVGAVLGVAVYLGQEPLRIRYLGAKRSRPFQVSRAGLARTFQLTRELDGLTVRENLLLAPQGQRGENLLLAWVPIGGVASQEADLRERADEVLALLELSYLADEHAGNLSGGQRKLLELGRVLMTDPELILLDEPVAGVNPTLTEKLLDRIEALAAEGYTFCVVEHDMEVIMAISDRVIVMDQGTKLMAGSPEEVRGDERVIEAYLGG